MLKQILATTAVIAVTVVSVHSASAATKLRSLVIEPTAVSTDPLLKKKKRPQLLIAQPGQGIPTPEAGAGNSGGKKNATFVVAPGGGIPTPAGNGVVGKSNGNGKAVAQFVVAPAAGIPTSGGGAGVGKPGGQKFVPLLVKSSNGIKVASADPSAPTSGKAFPLVADPARITTSIGGDPGTEVGAGGSPLTEPAAASRSTGASDPVRVDNSGGAAPEAPADATAADKPAIETAQDLYSVLVARGYGVEILKQDAYGNLVFYVTSPGHPKEADLLLVDAEYGKVKERKHILAYDRGYDRPVTYAPSYAPALVNSDNCNGY